MVKASGGQRESDGVVVPVIGVQHNAPGGKGPDFSYASGVSKRRGMTGTARSNHPGGREPVVLNRLDSKRRRIQHALGFLARRSRAQWRAV